MNGYVNRGNLTNGKALAYISNKQFRGVPIGAYPRAIEAGY